MSILTRAALFLSFLTLTGFGAPGCAIDSDSENGRSSSSLTRHSYCARSVCDKVREDCNDYIDECFGQCYGMSPEFAYQCVSVCNDYECPTCTVDECESYSYEFEATGAMDPDVFEACRRYEAKAAQCGEDTSRILCDRFARLERPEAAAAYDCIAQAPCGSAGTGCEPPATDWGLKFCLALNAKCYYVEMGCTAEQVSQLNLGAAWLKDDVRAEAMRCLEEPSCDDVAACTNAWLSTVFP